MIQNRKVGNIDCFSTRKELKADPRVPRTDVTKWQVELGLAETFGSGRRLRPMWSLEEEFYQILGFVFLMKSFLYFTCCRIMALSKEACVTALR